MEGGEKLIIGSSLFSLIIRGLEYHLSVILYFPYAVSFLSFKPVLSQRRIKKNKWGDIRAMNACCLNGRHEAVPSRVVIHPSEVTYL